MQTETQVIYTILGAVLCLGGWAIFWLGSRLLGLALGMAFGFFFGDLLGLVLKLDENATVLVLLACSIMGAFGGLLLMRAATTFVFGLAGFLFGALLGRMGCEMYAEVKQETYAFTAPIAVIVIAAGMVMGVLAFWMQKYIMILITSYVGSTFLVAGVEWLQQHEPWSVPGVTLLAIGWQMLLVMRLIADTPSRVADAE
ncbi:MAG: DUF4203 domain-containing protein [Candidatus Sumerlaeaceae bacterium]